MPGFLTWVRYPLFISMLKRRTMPDNGSANPQRCVRANLWSFRHILHTLSMSSVVCEAWQRQVQAFFTSFYGHQSKALAWFVLGAIRAKSVVLPQVAEALLAESEAKVSSIERRLERFLSNPRIDVKEVWEELLTQVLPFFQTGPIIA
jgi:hypothetical protein